MCYIKNYCKLLLLLTYFYYMLLICLYCKNNIDYNFTQNDINNNYNIVPKHEYMSGR